ncbi:rho GTPase-activating protein gacGG-like [Bactrocera tryoni]|uniref:rho GTPase-activating protein gacGG-like n=1 Tax=Bactrocera tryoni TaxID=59916 RepID=UPI001A9908F8|nr:rho GTPase-activating protein gacGG-like [Bactrocera tryoni]
MNSFSRAYRDPKSPLTPLTPLTASTAFNFNISGDSLKPFINAIEAERTKETPKSSPAGLACGAKYVNANKYIKRQPANVLSDTTNKSRKLSPRFISKKSDVDDKKTLKKSNNDLNNNKISSRYSSTSISSSSSRGSFKCNESSFKETDTIPSSKFKLSPRATSTYNYYSVSSSQSSSHSSSGSINSNNSSTTPNSFNYNGSARHHKPPKLVLNDTNVAETDSTMSTVFNWVWNCLSPMKNPSIYDLLARVDMQKYWEIFEKEEILDLDVFSTLTMADLAAIGIKDTNDCIKILKSVGWALDFLSGLLNFKRPEK